MDQTILAVEVTSLKEWWRPEMDLEQNLRDMFARVRAEGTPMGWAHRDDDLFRCVVGTAMLQSTEEDRAWLEAQMRALAKVSRALQGAQLGVPVTADAFESANEDIASQPKRGYALMELWHASGKSGTRTT